MIPNGCDLDLFGAENTSEHLLSSLPFGERDRVSGNCNLVGIFTGTHGIANGLDAVLDAARELIYRSRKDIRLIFIGDGKLKPVVQGDDVASYLTGFEVHLVEFLDRFNAKTELSLAEDLETCTFCPYDAICRIYEHE